MNILLSNRTGSERTNDLKEALDAENEKSKQMEAAMEKVDIEMKRSDELLSQMIPKTVTDKVKQGLNPVDTCEVFILNIYNNQMCIEIIRVLTDTVINYFICPFYQRCLNKSRSFSTTFQHLWTSALSVMECRLLQC